MLKTHACWTFIFFLRVVHVGAPCLQQPQEERLAGVPISAFLTLKTPKLILRRALTPSHLISMAQKQRRVGEAWGWGGGRGGVSKISRERGQVCTVGGAGERKGLTPAKHRQVQGTCPGEEGGSPCRTIRDLRFQASEPTMFPALLPLRVFRVVCVLPARGCCNKRIFGTLSEGTTKQRAKGYYLEVHGTY